jgi:hypothetical protein
MRNELHRSPGLREIARALGGEVIGRQVLAPGPGHSRRDRSLSVTLSSTSPDGFLQYSFCGDGWMACRDHIRSRLGPRDNWKRDRKRSPTPRPTPTDADTRAKALWLWRRRRPIEDSIAEIYLRKARGYGGAIPRTLGFLPSCGDHAPALIAALALPSEPEPGVLEINDDAVRAVQLIRLRPDGSGKADGLNKLMIGKGALGVPIVIAPPNDLLGLSIAEGIEDALSVHQATGLGAWAAGGATRMPALAGSVPDFVDFLTVVGDGDPAGVRFANELAERLSDRRINHRVSFMEAAP